MLSAQKRSWLICLSLIGLIAAVYWPVQHFEFLLYDDTIYVSLNPHVQHGLTLKEIGWAFYTNHCTNWHPLTWLTHMLDWQLFGKNAGLQHVTNVLLHMASAVMLFIVAKEMTGGLWRSATLAALFALHPLRVESVAWIAERKDVLSTLFFVLTLWAYGRYVRPQKTSKRFYYLLAVAFFALGLMSKPMIVTLPFVLLLLDVWPLQRWKLTHAEPPAVAKQRVKTSNLSGLTARQLVIEKWPFFLLTLAGCAVTLWAQGSGGAVTSLVKLPLLARIEHTFVAYVFYLRCIFWPVNLASPYPHPGYAPVLKLVGVLVIFSAISALALIFRKRCPWILIGWLWFLGTLVPVIGLVQVGAQGYADRYTYIPSIGILFAVIWSVDALLQKVALRRMLAGAAIASSVAACVILTSINVPYWANTKSLFEHAIAVTKNNAFAQNNLAAYLVEHGDPNGAVQHALKALEIVPNYPDPHDSLAFGYTQTGRDLEAIPEYEKTLSFQGINNQERLSLLHNGYGTSLARTGHVAEASEQFRQCVELNPTLPEGHCNYGMSLSTLGRTAEAVAQFQEALRLRPSYDTPRNMLEKLTGQKGG